MQNTKLLLIGLALTACAAQAADNMPADNLPPDNSGVNQRDRSDQTLTADDQSNSKSDITLAAKVRRAVMKKRGLSMQAKNIKIIAQDGTVTLRGPVKSSAERASIEKTVRKAAGKASIDNQLEVN